MDSRYGTIVVVLLCTAGCGDGSLETQQGLQEQNAVLQDQVRAEKETVVDLHRQILSYRSELEKVRQDTSRDAERQILALKQIHQDEIRSYEDRITRAEEIQRKQSAQLEGTISSQQLELGAIRREKLSLPELVDRGPRIAQAQEVRGRIELSVVYLLLGLALLLLGFLAVRYRDGRARLNLLLMQRVSELRHVGNTHEQAT